MACSSGRCSPRDSASRECICTVCTCGCHKCPQKHTSVYTKYGDIISEYGAKYPEWPIQEKFQRKPAPPRPNTAPMSSTTTYRDAYINHPFGPSTSCRLPPKVADKSCQKETDYRTTYGINYWDKSTQMCTRAKAPHAQHTSEKRFEGQSMYQLEFPNHGPQPCNKQVIRPACLVNKTSKFEGDTTYHDAYRQWEIPAKCVHKTEYTPPPPAECGPTTYQSDYVDRHSLNKCPVLSRSKPSTACGDHMCY